MLTIIQGDTFEADIEIEGVIPETVDKVIFSCSKLKFAKNALHQESSYFIDINASKTAEFSAGLYSYDITVYFKGGEAVTAKRNGILEVLRKVNSG